MSTDRPRKQIHLAAHFPGVNNTTVWGDPASGSHIAFSSFRHFAQTAERAKFDFLFLAEGLRLREQAGKIYDLDVMGRPDNVSILMAMAAVTERIGLAGTVNSTFNEPLDVARKLASLDHLSGGRAAWNVVTSWDEFTGENFRRGGYLPKDKRYLRAQEMLSTAQTLWDSWDSDGIVADPASGEFLRRPDEGAFEVHSDQFDITGRFPLPRSPQGRPVIIQAGDSEEGREFAAASADAIFTRHAEFHAGQEFYADVKARLAKFGRRPEDLKILPAATFVLGDTEAEAAENARQVQYQQVGPATAIAFAEQVWNLDLSDVDPDGPVPSFDPKTEDDVDSGGHISKGRASVRHVPRPGRDGARVARARRGREPVAARGGDPQERAAHVRRDPAARRGHHRRLRPERRLRRVRPGPAHHAGRAGRVRRPGGAAAPGEGVVPHRVRRDDAAGAPGARAAALGRPGAVMIGR